VISDVRRLALSVGVIAIALVVAGTGAVLARPGDLDATFAGDGRRLVDLGGEDRGVAVFPLLGGRILLVGQSVSGDGTVRVGLVRLFADGRLDRSFAGDGRVLRAPLEIERVEHAALTPGGRIIVLVARPDDHFALLRLHADGRIDRSFGDRGIVRMAGSSYPGSLLVTEEGRILVGHHRISRFHPNGAPDTSFGNGGSIGMSQYHAALMLAESDGDIVAFGPTGASYAGRRLHDDGSRDHGFGRDIDSNAFISVHPRYDLSGAPIAGAFAPDGRIVIAALAGVDGPDLVLDGLVAAFTRDGKVARAFSRDGWRTLDFGGLEYLTGLAIRPDGRVLVVGTRMPDPDDIGPDRVVLASLDPDGTLDDGFGAGGKVTTRVMGDERVPPAADMEVVGSRALVVGGARGDFLVLRYRIGR
jgi:uncharacterized delta-60 repeat protein